MGVSIRSNEIVFEVLCKEKSGDILRRARPLSRGVDECVHVLRRLRGLPSMFSAVPMTTFRPIWDALDSGWEVLVVDDVGLMAVGSTPISGHIDVHITFWDRVLRGREDLARAGILWAMLKSGETGAYTAVPSSAKTTIAFAKRVGFEVSGWMLDGAIDRWGRVDDSVVLTYRG